jgi:hypothetical protein
MRSSAPRQATGRRTGSPPRVLTHTSPLRAGVQLVAPDTGLRHDLERYLRYYNTDRAHTGRNNPGRVPIEILGKAKMWAR